MGVVLGVIGVAMLGMRSRKRLLGYFRGVESRTCRPGEVLNFPQPAFAYTTLCMMFLFCLLFGPP